MMKMCLINLNVFCYDIKGAVSDLKILYIYIRRANKFSYNILAALQR